MRKKSISFGLKTIGYVAVGCVGLYFSMFLLKSSKPSKTDRPKLVCS